MAGVTVSNLVQGPAVLYTGTYSSTGAAEPADTAVNSTPATSAWTDMGGTVDGTTLEIGREYAELAVDQIVDTPERRLTKRELTIVTNLAEATIENLVIAQNEAIAVVTTGSGFKSYSPAFATAATQPTYIAVIVDGYAPSNFRRRLIARKVLSIDPTAIAYKKGDQTLYPVKWASHYVSASLAPFKVIDQTS